MQAELAHLVGSRICHDLISPIGAIGNGVELLALTDGSSGEEMALIKQSVESAAARIKFFRIAYGFASDQQSVGQAEIRSILAPLTQSGRISYVWAIAGDVPRLTLRCVFLLVQALEYTLPLGGEILAQREAGQDGITLTATGRRIAFDPNLWDGLTAPATGVPPYTAAQVQFALLPSLLSETGVKPRVSATETSVKVRL